MCKDRFGVVNAHERQRYEKEYNVSYGYKFISFIKAEAIKECRQFNNQNFIVERIKDDNTREEIFRSGNFKE
jgi:hypothetical protein